MRSINLFLAAVLCGYSEKKCFVDFPYKKVLIQFADFLSKNRMISSFKVFEVVKYRSRIEKKIRVFLNINSSSIPGKTYMLNNYNCDFEKIFSCYTGNSVKEYEISKKYNSNLPFHSVKRISKPSNTIFVGYKQIRDMLVFNKLFIISSSIGFITGEEAVRKKTGGILLFVVNF